MNYQWLITFSSASINSLDNINEFLGVFERPIDFIVVSRAQIDHDVLISVEKHNGTWVVKLVHFVEVGHLRNVD